MKIYNTKNSKIIVLSGSSGSCPRIKVVRNTTLIRDDHHGEIKSKMLGLVSYLL